jgi:hypothetical protein
MESSRTVDTAPPHLEYRSKGSMSARCQALSVNQHASENDETNSLKSKVDLDIHMPLSQRE